MMRGAAWLALGALATLLRAAEADPAARVVLLANASDPDSLRVAHHYVEARGVPVENIIALPMPVAEVVTWREFVATIWEPLEAELIRAKWIDAIPMALTDALGRRKIDVHSHRITALVVCRGVPLAIGHDPARYVDTPPLTQRAEFQIGRAHV